jgi:hypothetical protein
MAEGPTGVMGPIGLAMPLGMAIDNLRRDLKDLTPDQRAGLATWLMTDGSEETSHFRELLNKEAVETDLQMWLDQERWKTDMHLRLIRNQGERIRELEALKNTRTADEEMDTRLKQAVHCLISSGRELMSAWRRYDYAKNDINRHELENCRDRFELTLATWDLEPR